ncbi:MAG: ABC transporter ATP-binding protein [Anaerolineales bacterium]|nr:ABC transporter ATP-binding protein [Anaerolineales bacterium]
MMKDAIIVEGLGKKFYHYSKDRPSTVLEMLARGLPGLRPERVFWGLRGIDFRISSGQIVGVIGENGAGKSTLLQLLGGVGRPDEGRVKVHGRIGGFLDLKAGLRPDLTGRENVYISGVISGLTRREVDERFDSIVDFAEIGEFIESPLRTYSTGMQMRLAFAVAAHTSPDILLIDEVLAVGDEAFRRKCFTRLEQFKEEGTTIVIVSHQVTQVRELCDEVLWLHNGHLVAHGDPEMVVGQYSTEMSMTKKRRLRSVVSNDADADDPTFRARGKKHRFGTNEMEITAVLLRDKAGDVVQSLPAGEPLTVEVVYKAPKTIAEPIFNVVITRERQVCCAVNTAGEEEVEVVAGNGRFTLEFDRLDLVNGLYHIDVGIHAANWSHAYDYHWHLYPLEITANDGGHKGVLRPPFRWRLEPAAGAVME